MIDRGFGNGFTTWKSWLRPIPHRTSLTRGWVPPAGRGCLLLLQPLWGPARPGEPRLASRAPPPGECLPREVTGPSPTAGASCAPPGAGRGLQVGLGGMGGQTAPPGGLSCPSRPLPGSERPGPARAAGRCWVRGGGAARRWVPHSGPQLHRGRSPAPRPPGALSARPTEPRTPAIGYG